VLFAFVVNLSWTCVRSIRRKCVLDLTVEAWEAEDGSDMNCVSLLSKLEIGEYYRELACCELVVHVFGWEDLLQLISCKGRDGTGRNGFRSIGEAKDGRWESDLFCE